VDHIGAPEKPELPDGDDGRKTRADELTEELFEPTERPETKPAARNDEPVVITPDDIPF